MKTYEQDVTEGSFVIILLIFSTDHKKYNVTHSS